MALKIENFQLSDGMILNSAYLKVHNINTNKIDYEKLEPIDGTDDLLTTWISKIETSVLVYVYADDVARKNQVSPMQWFEFNLDYDLNSNKNIFKQTYERLKHIYPEGEDC